MKKMIMILAAVAMAACAQAATVTWTAVDPNAKGVYLLVNGSAKNSVQSAYDGTARFLTEKLITGIYETWDDQLASLADESMAGVYESKGNGTFELTKVLGTNTNLYNYQALIVTYDDEKMTPGGSFSVYIADDTDQSHSFDLSTMTAYASGNFGGEAIPEPTSGLLLLLGMAGLALKRKVA